MIINIILGLAIALLPLFTRITSIDFIRESKDFLFITIAFLLMAILGKPIRKIPMPLILSSIYILIMITFNQHTSLSFGVIITTVEIAAGWFLFIKYYQCHEKESFRFIYYGMMIGAITQSFIGISQFFGSDLYVYVISLFIKVKQSNPGTGHMMGSLGNNNLLASYLCIAIPSFFTNKNTKYLSIVPISALLMTQTYMGILALLAGIIFYLVKSKKIIYILACIFMVFLPFFNIGIDSGRFFVWRKIISEASLKHWLIGMGPGWFPDLEMKMASGTTILQEHNSFLTVFNTFGLLGLLLLLPVFVKTLRHKSNNRILESIVFIIFCNSWGHFTVQQSTVMIIVIPTLAVYIAEVYNGNE